MGIWPLSKLLAARQARGRALRSASTPARLHLEHLEERQMLSMDGLPVIDDFDRPDSPIISEAWLELAGDFAIADQQLVADLVGISLAMVDGVNAGDVGLSARVDLTDLDNAQAGLVARYSQADDAMYVGTLVRANSAVTAEIWRGREGAWSVLAAGSTTAVSGTLKFTVEGDHLRLFLDGALLLEVIDAAPLDAGGVGLRASGGALYDDLRIESRRTTEISHTIEDDRSVQLTWLPLPEQAAYHTVVTDSSTGETHFSGWVYGTSLRLDLPSGTYKARVAASGMPYAEHTLSVVFSVEAFDHEVLDSGDVKLFWTPVEGANAYHLIVKNSDTQVEARRGWVYSTSMTFALEPGNYSAWVAPSGAAYAVHSFSVVPPLAPQSLESVDYTYIAPGKATIFWDDVPGVLAYFVTIRDSDDVVVYRDWVRDVKLAVDFRPDNYVVSVAVSGQHAVTVPMFLADFSQSTFTPLSPIGQTDRQQLRFTWFPVAGAVSYYFQLRELDGPVVEGHWVHGGTETAASTPPGEYQWRVIPLNERNEQAANTGWVSLSVSDAPLVRENILGIEPDVPVPAHLVVLNVPQTAIRASDGTVYIADTLSNVIRRVRDGQVDVFAGTLEAGYNGDGYRTSVMLSQPAELIFDSDENLLVVDTGNNLIRKIDLDTGQVTTVMGLPGQKAMPTDGQAASDSPLGWTTALIYDAQGNLYIPTSVDRDGVGDGDSRLFYISPDGIVHESSVALPGQVSDIRIGEDVIEIIYRGTFQRIFSDGTRRTDEMPSRFGGGIVYRADTNTTLVGNHGEVYEFDADFNRTTFASGFANVTDVNEAGDGFLVADGDRGAVIEFDRQGRQIPGRSIGSTSTEGTGTIVDVTRYDDDTLLFLENKKGYVYSYSPSTGRTVVLAGNGRLERATLGVDSSLTGFWYPNAIAVDSHGNIYITENHRIIKIDTSGQTSLFAGDAASGDVATEVGGNVVSAADARFQSIRDIVFDSNDTMYVADTYNNKIKTISPEGIVTTIAGSGIAGISALGVDQFDIPAIEANLNHPFGVLPLNDGTVLVSNSWSSTLGRIETDGMLRHVAGIARTANYQGGGLYDGDGGQAADAYLNTPQGLAVSPSGVIYFADTFNHVIRSIDNDGIISTVWGRGRRGFAADGSLLSYPTGIFLDGDGLFVTDSGNGLASRIHLSINDADRYTLTRSITPITPLANVQPGVVEFRFDRDPLDYAYYLQLYHDSGDKVWQGYIYANSWQTELATGGYRWRVTPLAKIDGTFVFAPPNDWVEFSVESESMSFKTVLDSLVGINLKSQHLSGAEFSYEILSVPNHGTLLSEAAGSLQTYRPNVGFVGDDGFTYRVRNEAGQSVLVSVQLNVRQPDHPSRSYFVPGFGTIGVAQGTPAAPVFSGAQLPTELVVSSGLGNVIEKFGTDGQIQWRYHKSATWPGVAVQGDQVIFNDFKSIFFLDLETGALKRELKFDTTIEFVSPQEEGLLIGLRGEEKQTIVLWNEQQGVVWTNPHDVLFPRWADMRGDLVVIADTLNHRFYGVDRNTGEMTFSVEAFFPNDVRFTADNEILFVEEHADRVWKYNIETGNRTWVFGAGNGMENLELSVAEIRTISNELRIDPDDPRSMSKSSKTYSGPVTLYSPNGAVQLADGSYYIADTDNHRVVHVSADGQLLAELEGFNNPNKIAIVPPVP